MGTSTLFVVFMFYLTIITLEFNASRMFVLKKNSAKTPKSLLISNAGEEKQVSTLQPTTCVRV
jgi:hypothetical protein